MEKDAKTVDSAINNLTMTVFDLQNKVLSLEKIIMEQNITIKKLVSAYEKYSASGVELNVKPHEGRHALKPSQQPMDNACDRATSAVFATDRKSKRNIQSTAPLAQPENIAATAEPTRTLPNPTSSENAAAAPASLGATDRREFLNLEKTTNAHRGVTENHTSNAHAQIGEWVNVKPRRSRRSRAANESLNAVGDQMPEDIPSMDVRVSDNQSKAKTRRITPVSKGCNTSVLRIKAVERRKYFHVWRLLIDTSEQNLTEYVREILGAESYIKVDKISHKIVRGYSSFRICVSESNFEKLCDPSIWPKDAEFSEWVFFRRTAPENTHTKK